MLTVSDDEADLFDAVKAGANGYLLKDVSVEEVADAVRAVVQGQSLITPSMATKLTTFPSTRISPASGRSIPERMLIRVDLPAPFSPSRQCTSPCRAASEMSSFARTPGNRLVMPSSSTAGAPVGVAAVRLSDSVRSLCVATAAAEAAAAHCSGPRLRRGYFCLINALTCPALVVSGTLIVPFITPAFALWICAHTLAGIKRVLSSEIPPFASVRL